MDLHLHTLETTSVNASCVVVRIEIKDIALEARDTSFQTTPPKTWREYLDSAELD